MPVEELIQLEQHQVMEWIVTGGYVSEEDFFWRGLVELTTARATYRRPEERRPEWASVALAVIARAEALDVISPHDAVGRRLNLGVVMLKQFGSTSDKVPYQPDDLARLFLSEVAFEVEEVRCLPHWRTLPLPLIRALRHIKTWLSPVSQIVDQVSDSERQRRLRSGWRSGRAYPEQRYRKNGCRASKGGRGLGKFSWAPGMDTPGSPPNGCGLS